MRHIERCHIFQRGHVPCGEERADHRQPEKIGRLNRFSFLLLHFIPQQNIFASRSFRLNACGSLVSTSNRSLMSVVDDDTDGRDAAGDGVGSTILGKLNTLIVRIIL